MCTKLNWNVLIYSTIKLLHICTQQPTIKFQPHISCFKQISLLYILKASRLTQLPAFNSEKTKAQRGRVTCMDTQELGPGSEPEPGAFQCCLLPGVKLSSFPNSSGIRCKSLCPAQRLRQTGSDLRRAACGSVHSKWPLMQQFHSSQCLPGNPILLHFGQKSCCHTQ